MAIYGYIRPKMCILGVWICILGVWTCILGAWTCILVSGLVLWSGGQQPPWEKSIYLCLRGPCKHKYIYVCICLQCPCKHKYFHQGVLQADLMGGYRPYGNIINENQGVCRFGGFGVFPEYSLYIQYNIPYRPCVGPFQRG